MKIKDRITKDIYKGCSIKGLDKDVIRKAMMKIMMLEAATDLKDLMAPPGNRLEKLKGDRAGQYSIRVNDKYRICFYWENNEAREVEFVDYH